MLPPQLWTSKWPLWGLQSSSSICHGGPSGWWMDRHILMILVAGMTTKQQNPKCLSCMDVGEVSKQEQLHCFAVSLPQLYHTLCFFGICGGDVYFYVLGGPLSLQNWKLDLSLLIWALWMLDQSDKNNYSTDFCHFIESWSHHKKTWWTCFYMQWWCELPVRGTSLTTNLELKAEKQQTQTYFKIYLISIVCWNPKISFHPLWSTYDRFTHPSHTESRNGTVGSKCHTLHHRRGHPTPWRRKHSHQVYQQYYPALHCPSSWSLLKWNTMYQILPCFIKRRQSFECIPLKQTKWCPYRCFHPPSPRRHLFSPVQSTNRHCKTPTTFAQHDQMWQFIKLCCHQENRNCTLLSW